MKLKTAKNIEKALRVAMNIVSLPFIIVLAVLELLEKPMLWLLGWRDYSKQRIGNRLMHMSDAVKDGTIKNPYCLRNYTARMAWEHLQRANESGKEADI